MNQGPDYQQLYETAESQAGYFAAHQARKCGFSWERDPPMLLKKGLIPTGGIWTPFALPTVFVTHLWETGV